MKAKVQVLPLLSSPYFQDLLGQDPGYLAGKKEVQVWSSQIKLVTQAHRMDIRATAACLSYLCSMDASQLYVTHTQLTPDTLFSHFHAAFFFQLNGLVETLAEKIAELLAPDTIVPSIALAVHTQSSGLLMACYQWLQRYFFGQQGLVNLTIPLDSRLTMVPPKLAYTRSGYPPEDVSLECFRQMGAESLRKVSFYHVTFTQTPEPRYTLM